MSFGTLRAHIHVKINEFEKSTKSFVDRIAELNDLVNTYMPIVIVYGKYGQGKTKLAKMLVQELIKRGEEVVYIALRLADQRYKDEFLTLTSLYKTYYDNRVGLIPGDMGVRFLGPLVIDPKGLGEIYKDLIEETINIHVPHRESLAKENLKSVYTDRPAKLIEEASKRIKGRLTIIIDEYEDLINTIARREGEAVTYNFINSVFQLARYAYDQNPGLIRLILMTIPRTVVDIRSIIAQGTTAWVGVARHIDLAKLSEEALLDYAKKTLNYILQREGEDIKLEDIIDNESIELFKKVLKTIPVTRLATDLIKQIITDIVTYLAESIGAASYDDMIKKLPKILENLHNSRKKLRYNVTNFLNLITPSHDTLVKNYRKFLDEISKTLTTQFNMTVISPVPITMQRGYESYYLEVIKVSKEKERIRFIFWLKPTVPKPRKELTVDRISKVFNLMDAYKMGVKVVFYVVTFEESKHLGYYIDLLNACKYVILAIPWIHDETLKYVLANTIPAGFVGEALKAFLNEEINALAQDIVFKVARL